MTTPQVLTEEEYLTLHGANEHEICDPALHQPDWAGRSGAHKRALLKVNNKAWIEFRDKRIQLRKEYGEKVALGEIRPPTMVEKLLIQANGDECNESTHAARRALRKRGLNSLCTW